MIDILLRNVKILRRRNSEVRFLLDKQNNNPSSIAKNHFHNARE